MGMNVQLVSERGEVIEEVSDGRSRLHPLIESVPEYETTHCLQYMDPYGDTIFNSLQLPRFLDEWRVVVGLAVATEDKELASSVQRLARLAEEKIHMYLRFVGD